LGRFQQKLSVPFYSVGVQAGPALKRCVWTDRRDSNSRTGGSNHALRTHRWGVGCHPADAAEQAAWRSSGAPDRRTQNRDLPTAFGPYTACYNRFVGWRRAGIWGRIIETLATAHDAAVQMIDTLHPPKSNRSDPICFSPYLYRARNQVERFFNRIKQCRRVATRYDRLAANYLAFVQLASIRLWLRLNESAS
jgi:transposase